MSNFYLISDWSITSSFSEDKTSGSEYVPSTTSNSSLQAKKRKQINLLPGLRQSPIDTETPSSVKVEDWLQSLNKFKKAKDTKIKVLQNIIITNSNNNGGEKSDSEESGSKIIENTDCPISSERNFDIDDPKGDLDNVCEDGRKREESTYQDEHITDVDEKKSIIVPVTETIIYETKRRINNKNGNILINKAVRIEGRLVRDKVHSCYFCMGCFQNMARHFEKIHGNELAVAKILAMEKKSRRRRDNFAELIRAGDFNHNCEVMALKQGELILVRRPTESEARYLTFSDYGPCPQCLGFLLKKHLWHHMKYCSQKGQEDPECHINKNVIAESNAILNQVLGTDLSSSFISNIVSKIRQDDIGICCVNDNLILKFGGMLFEKYDVTQCELIRQSMRQMGKFQ